MSDRYCVFGNPIGHSKSPLIHAAFARQTGEDIEYSAVLAPIDGFTACVHRFIESGGKGANVTVPFKQEAYRMASRLSPRARLAGAVNTLIFSDGEITGDNTDGCGLLRDITKNIGHRIAGQRILLLGAGGAARGAIGPLLEEGPRSLTVVNRTRARAEALRNDFLPFGAIDVRDYASLHGQSFDLIIDATSSALQESLPPLPECILAPGSLVYSMMYGPATIPLRLFAETGGAARFADGLGMLVEQAAESFFIWRGVRPDSAPLRALLEQQ